MKYTDDDLKFIIKEEGIVLHPYQDSKGIWTIGVGCTRYENGNMVSKNDSPITYARAIELMCNLLDNEFIPEVKKAVKVSQNSHQVTAVVSLAFNIGTDGFARSTLAKRINASASADLITEGFKMWKFAGDKPVLLPRRIREAKLYHTPVKSPDVYVLTTPKLMYDEHIKYIQKVLGFHEKDQDGWYGPETVAKVKDFQTFHGLKPDGICGRMTMNIMNVISTGTWDEATIDLT